MGAQSSHEHIFVDDAKSSIVTHAYPETFPTEQIVTDGIAALKKFKANGGGSIVDCTTVDLGRNITLMEQVSRESGVNIIATTGCWINVPLVWGRSDPDDLAALYVRDCTVRFTPVLPLLLPLLLLLLSFVLLLLTLLLRGRWGSRARTSRPA